MVLSTAEGELVALCELTKCLLWIRHLSIEVGALNTSNPVPIYCDNQAAILLGTTTFCKSQRTRHLQARWKFTQQHARWGEIDVIYVSTKYQLADILTKALAKDTFEHLTKLVQTSYCPKDPDIVVSQTDVGAFIACGEFNHPDTAGFKFMFPNA